MKRSLRILGTTAAGSILALGMVGPAFAVDNTQTVTGTLGSTIGAITNGSQNLLLLPGATATNTDGTVTVTSNVSYDLSVVADQANMTKWAGTCLLYTSPSPRDRTRPRMPSSA